MGSNGSLPVRGAWIEIKRPKEKRIKLESLPVRGAWIEIPPTKQEENRQNVAPRKGSVD